MDLIERGEKYLLLRSIGFAQAMYEKRTEDMREEIKRPIATS